MARTPSTLVRSETLACFADSAARPSTEQIATQLNISPQAAYARLSNLASQRLVASRRVRRRNGRPVLGIMLGGYYIEWRLTNSGLRLRATPSSTITQPTPKTDDTQPEVWRRVRRNLG